jgi:predicted TIM-barrel fold metal-dependent hydrolase
VVVKAPASGVLFVNRACRYKWNVIGVPALARRFEEHLDKAAVARAVLVQAETAQADLTCLLDLLE